MPKATPKSGTVEAPCSTCLGETTHNVLHSAYRYNEHASSTYKMLQCAGCGRICMSESERDLGDESLTISYYPTPVARKEPRWSLDLSVGIVGGPEGQDIAAFFHEIYQCLHSGQVRLAVMGIRALLELVMISKTGDQGSFKRNLDAFQSAGYISLLQRDAVSDILDAGHAVMHRRYNPTAEDLNTALDIAEGVLASIYVHIGEAQKVRDRVPPRKR